MSEKMLHLRIKPLRCMLQSFLELFERLFYDSSDPKVWVHNRGWIIGAPNIHKTHHHHHYERLYRDTNYGNIFAIGDWLFVTFSKVTNKKIVYGIDTHLEMHAETAIGSL